MDEIISRSADKASLGQRAPEALSPQDVEETLLNWHHGRLKAAAKRRLPGPIFDYVEGGAYDEVTLRANVADLARLKLRQRVLTDDVPRKHSTTIAGQHASMPVALAPIGFAGLMYPRGEILAAKAARAFGVPFCLSTFSACSIEGVAGAVGGPFLFQLYLLRDRGINAALLQRAEEAGCSGLVLTLDTAVPGQRNRDLDNGLGVPVRLRPRLAMRMAAKPRWVVGWLRSRHAMGNLAAFAPPEAASLGDIVGWGIRNCKAVDIAEAEWVRKHWSGKLILKGVLDPEDAKRAVALGADAIVVSNHGGRQLDSAQSTAKAFPAIRDAVGGEVELLFDGGVRSGFDVLKVLGLGAKACLIGRAYVYGLAAYGEAGVTTALRLLARELDTGMALTGVADVSALPEGLLIFD